MKKLICFALLAASVSFVYAQKPARKSALQSMVDTERAFSKMSVDLGTRPSFVAFIAEDGILFRPRAVKGKQWMIDHPLPAPRDDKRSLLNWYPAVAEIALAGDMGWTTGPWEFKNDIKDEKPVAWGNFLTVWKKQADGSWKFAIDLGISNPQPDQAPAQWQLPKDYKHANVGGVGPGPNSSELLAREREFSSASAARGTQKAFEEYASAEIRMFREGKQPIAGKANALAALAENSDVLTWDPAFADMSKSVDLGYTYGTYRILKKDAQPTVLESGNYFRIWKRDRNKWVVVADLLNPVKDEKTN